MSTPDDGRSDDDGGFEPYPRYPQGPGPYPGGAEQPQHYGAGLQQTNRLAIGGTVAGVLGLLVVLFLSPLIGAILGIVALVLGIMSRKRVLESGEAGKNYATAGIALGAVDIVLFVALLIWIGTAVSSSN